MKIVAFGETMMRLSTPNNTALSQAQSLDMMFCGTGVNLLRNLYQCGHDVSLVSVVPNNDVGIAALSHLRKLGINERSVYQNGNHIGIYFLEAGHGTRPTKVTYMNRNESSFNTYAFSESQLKAMIEDADLVHICGITCQTSKTSRKNALMLASLCESMQKTLCFDFNFRQSLVAPENYDTLVDAYKTILKKSTIVFGNRIDLQKTLKIEGDTFEDLCTNFMHEYNVEIFSGTFKTVDETNKLTIQGFLCKDNVCELGHPLSVDVLDGIGSGDAYASGILSGLFDGLSISETLEFATRCCAVAYATHGDYLNVTKEEIQNMHPSKSQSILR